IVARLDEWLVKTCVWPLALPTPYATADPSPSPRENAPAPSATRMAVPLAKRSSDCVESIVIALGEVICTRMPGPAAPVTLPLLDSRRTSSASSEPEPSNTIVSPAALLGTPLGDQFCGEFTSPAKPPIQV